jgi:hypothetical protein
LAAVGVLNMRGRPGDGGNAGRGEPLEPDETDNEIMDDISKGEKKVDNAIKEGDEDAINKAQRNAEQMEKSQRRVRQRQNRFDRNGGEEDEPCIRGINR